MVRTRNYNKSGNYAGKNTMDTVHANFNAGTISKEDARVSRKYLQQKIRRVENAKGGLINSPGYSSLYNLAQSRAYSSLFTTNTNGKLELKSITQMTPAEQQKMVNLAIKSESYSTLSVKGAREWIKGINERAGRKTSKEIERDIRKQGLRGAQAEDYRRQYRELTDDEITDMYAIWKDATHEDKINGKSQEVLEAISDYIRTHPNKSTDDIKRVFHKRYKEARGYDHRIGNYGGFHWL